MQHFNARSTYKCTSCNKMTRETGQGESDLGLCVYCLKEAWLENDVQDRRITEDEFEQKLAALNIQYGR